jgi:Cu2+-containing amine oxidase
VIKRIAQCDDLENCPLCKKAEIEGKHRLLGAVIFYGEKQDDAFYSIPLGRVVNGKKHMRQLAKEKGLIEVGNEKVDKLHSDADNYHENKSKERWSEFSKPIEING